MPGAADTIQKQLKHYGLHWDGKVLWESQHHDTYRAALALAPAAGAELLLHLHLHPEPYTADWRFLRWPLPDVGQRSAKCGNASDAKQSGIIFHDALHGQWNADEATEHAVVEYYAVELPAHGQHRTNNELR